MLQGCWSFDIHCYQLEQGGTRAQSKCTDPVFPFTAHHSHVEYFCIFKCTSGSEMPAFYLFLKELKQIAALTDPDYFSQATSI